MKEGEMYDFLIVGSGFAGTITAMGLANSGYRVVVIEKEKHPRFTIGESSTPIADMILRRLAEDYRLPFLKKLSRYGEWQKYHPDVVCGLKRGFSYYPHEAGESFKTDINHNNELLVAASKNDQNSDTNWLRSDVDHFLVKQLPNYNVDFFDKTEITNVIRIKESERWQIQAKREDEIYSICSKWIVDATGSPVFSNRFLGTTSSNSEFETSSSAIYSHLKGVKHWNSYLKERGLYTGDYPYNPDHSALHQLVEEGWIWMLRFNNDLLSAGLLLDGTSKSSNDDPGVHWQKVLRKYPSLELLFKDAKLAAVPGKWFQTGRLQRKLNRVYGDGWVALNHTAGFVDPLHSTGIAHTLSGMEKMLDIFSNNYSKNSIRINLKKLEERVFSELSFIDLLVSSSYRSRKYFPLFNASVMLYFIATIRYEQSRLNGEIPRTFLCSDHDRIRQIVVTTHKEIKSLEEMSDSIREADLLVEKIRERIAPFNRVKLMDPGMKNMYEHTAVSL